MAEVLKFHQKEEGKMENETEGKGNDLKEMREGKGREGRERKKREKGRG